MVMVMMMHIQLMDIMVQLNQHFIILFMVNHIKLVMVNLIQFMEFIFNLVIIN